MLTCLSFRTVVSRKLIELVDISCLKLIDATASYKWSMNSVIKKMSSMNGNQITR